LQLVIGRARARPTLKFEGVALAIPFHPLLPRPDRARRLAAEAAVTTIAVAALASLTLGALTAGYDPAARTVSRLAADGAPTAVAMTLVMVLLAGALGAFGAATARPGLVVAGLALLLVAAVPLGGASPMAHRAVALSFVAALLGSVLADARHSRLALVAGGIAGLALVAAAATYVAHQPVGGWERVILAPLLGWIALQAMLALRATA
jgi:lysylphosphatidylglycerol synthetase-like protein (DUF2156 family)